MILTCPSCGTRYRADPANFNAPGRHVRCAKCGQTWFQPPPEPEATPAPESSSTDATLRGHQQTLGQIGTERNLAADSSEYGASGGRIRNRILQTLGLMILLILLAGMGWAAERYRQTIVRLWPESSRFYAAVGLPVNLSGIAIRNIDFRQRNQDGTPVLSVTGRLVNISNRDQPIPRLRVVLRDRTKRELYRWTFDPGFSSLAPGAERDFGTSLPNPPPDAQIVDVTFAVDDGR